MVENKKYKLPREFGEKWVRFLRSGKYRQTKGIMYNDEDKGFCCLGIACKAAGHNPERIKQFETASGEVLHNLETSYINKLYPEGCKVPKDLVENKELQYTLVNFNDTDELSFEEIADWIEENCFLYD